MSATTWPFWAEGHFNDNRRRALYLRFDPSHLSTRSSILRMRVATGGELVGGEAVQLIRECSVLCCAEGQRS